MGYEINFHYKEATDKLGVYQEEVKIKSCRVGKYYEDVDLEVIAGKILAQMARRDIFIVDVEIFEFAKKKVNYKENKSGIVIKNKKFSFDSKVSTVDESEDSDDDDQPITNAAPMPNIAPKPKPNLNKRPLRYEIFDPELLAQHKAKQQGLKFTIRKRYPIYSEKSNGMTILYQTIDDAGREVSVSAEYFTPPGAGLIEGDSVGPVVGGDKEEINLWGNASSSSFDMPDIRGR